MSRNMKYISHHKEGQCSDIVFINRGQGSKVTAYSHVCASYFHQTFNVFACETFRAARSSAPYFCSRALTLKLSANPALMNSLTNAGGGG